MTLHDELKEIFDRHEYTWRVDGELQSPSADDIRKAIDKTKMLLLKEDAPSATAEVGHLVIKKTPGLFDIYVHIGTEPQTKET